MEQLDKLLATIFVARQNIHGRHFNVTGVHFESLHELFNDAYDILNNWYDKIGELIRRQSQYAIHNIPEMYAISSVKSDDVILDAMRMAQQSALDLKSVKVIADTLVYGSELDAGTENDLSQLSSDVDEMYYKIGSFASMTVPQ